MLAISLTSCIHLQKEVKLLKRLGQKKVAQDYDLLQVFGCPAFYHVKEDKLDPKARKNVFVGFKKRVKGYKIWDPKNKKFILSRNVMFNEASMVKPIDSQQVESQTMTDRILQQVESDTTSPSLYRSISFEVILSVTQGGDQVAEQDADNDEEDQVHVMADVHYS